MYAENLNAIAACFSHLLVTLFSFKQYLTGDHFDKFDSRTLTDWKNLLYAPQLVLNIFYLKNFTK